MHPGNTNAKQSCYTTLNQIVNRTNQTKPVLHMPIVLEHQKLVTQNHLSCLNHHLKNTKRTTCTRVPNQTPKQCHSSSSQLAWLVLKRKIHSGRNRIFKQEFLLTQGVISSTTSTRENCSVLTSPPTPQSTGYPERFNVREVLHCIHLYIYYV